MMLLDRLDASHLYSLHVLLEEQHVTRAARRLGITQSSMSHRLQRLREALGDPLLVRAGASLLPTPRAEAIAPRLAEALRALEAAVTPAAAFDPAASTQTLTLVLPDLLAPVLPRVLATVAKAAPRMNVCVRPVSAELPRLLASGPLSVALAPAHFVDGDTRARHLGDLRFAVAGRRGHPALQQRLTVSRWLAHGHVVVHVGNERANAVADALARRGLQRRVALEVPSFLAGLQVVANSDLLMNVPVPLVDDAARALGLVVQPAPMALPHIRFALLWHERFQHDAAHRWARDVVFAAVQPLLHQRPRE